MKGTDHDHDTLEFAPWSMVKTLETMGTDTLESAPWSIVKWSFWVKFRGYFEILAMEPWSWSKIFDHMIHDTRHPGVGQIVKKLIPPPFYINIVASPMTVIFTGSCSGS